MTVNDAVLQPAEKVIFALRELYLSAGYQPYRMSKFEEYDLYAKNKEFLVSDNVITFTDTDGKLMALKPDVTLSIIKHSPDVPEECRRVCYNENVYRVSGSTKTYREIMQAGLECFGHVSEDELVEVLSLACRSLSILEGDSVLAVSDLDLLGSVISDLGLDREDETRLMTAVGEKNLHEVERLTVNCEPDAAAKLKTILSVSGPVGEVRTKLDSLLGNKPEYASFIRTLTRLNPAGISVQIDFSVTDDPAYYNGIVFKGYLRGLPTAVLSGGQYDRLMRKLHRRSKAVGFAVYTDELTKPAGEPESGDYLNVALPKGRLGEKIYSLFAEAGFECPALLEPNRKLIFENAEKRVRYFWVKPSDVAIYVERGAADVGVAGKDILLEYEPDVYELMDLKAGKCRMAVAAPKGFRDNPARTLRVATKFATVARRFYQSQGRDIDIIHLNGSIEIAPILGLSDVIVDIVETGSTLRENNLEVVEDVVPITARLIANKTSARFHSAELEKLMNGLKAALEARE